MYIRKERINVNEINENISLGWTVFTNILDTNGIFLLLEQRIEFFKNVLELPTVFAAPKEDQLQIKMISFLR